jgi:hypothetical protein
MNPTMVFSILLMQLNLGAGQHKDDHEGEETHRGEDE